MNSPLSLGTIALGLLQERQTLWDTICPSCPCPQSLAVCRHFNGTVGINQVHDSQTKTTLSRGLDIIDSNVLKEAIRYHWVNDTNLRGEKMKYIIVYLQDWELLYPILLAVSYRFTALTHQNYPPTPAAAMPPTNSYRWQLCRAGVTQPSIRFTGCKRQTSQEGSFLSDGRNGRPAQTTSSPPLTIMKHPAGTALGFEMTAFFLWPLLWFLWITKMIILLILQSSTSFVI